MSDRARRMVGHWVTMAFLGVIAGLALTMGTGCDLARSSAGVSDDWYVDEWYPEENYYSGGGDWTAGEALETYLGNYVLY